MPRELFSSVITLPGVFAATNLLQGNGLPGPQQSRTPVLPLIHSPSTPTFSVPVHGSPSSHGEGVDSPGALLGPRTSPAPWLATISTVRAPKSQNLRDPGRAPLEDPVEGPGSEGRATWGHRAGHARTGEGKGKAHVLSVALGPRGRAARLASPQVTLSTIPRGLSDEPEPWTTPRAPSRDQGTTAAKPGAGGSWRKQGDQRGVTWSPPSLLMLVGETSGRAPGVHGAAALLGPVGFPKQGPPSLPGRLGCY